jgi:hypothetical protein
VAKRHHAVEVLEMSARIGQCYHLPGVASAAGVALPAAACEPCLRVSGCGHEVLAPSDPVKYQCSESCCRCDNNPVVIRGMAASVSGGSVDIPGCSSCEHPSAGEEGCA